MANRHLNYGPDLDRVHQDPNSDSFFGPGFKFDPNLQGLQNLDLDPDFLNLKGLTGHVTLSRFFFHFLIFLNKTKVYT